jgi:hypothetical protein
MTPHPFQGQTESSMILSNYKTFSGISFAYFSYVKGRQQTHNFEELAADNMTERFL